MRSGDEQAYRDEAGTISQQEIAQIVQFEPRPLDRRLRSTPADMRWQSSQERMASSIIGGNQGFSVHGANVKKLLTIAPAGISRLTGRFPGWDSLSAVGYRARLRCPAQR